jgi:HlyD family secretion protein
MTSDGIAGRSASAAVVFLLASALCGCAGDKPGTYQGYVEGEFVHVASPLGGRLEHLAVQRGQQVEADAPLFTLELEQETAAKHQAEEQLHAAQARLADLEKGQRPDELEVTKAELAQAVATERQTALQLERRQVQFDAGLIPQEQVDDARSAHTVAAARVTELQSRLKVSRLPSRVDQVREQGSQIEAQSAVLAQAEWRLGQKQVRSTQAGLVADTLYREGEWVPAGSPVVRILPPANVKVRFFVPEAVAGGLAPGRKVTLRCDGCPAAIAATVSFISTEPEFTPPVIYSNETRAKLVFMVEARPEVADAPQLRPGQPVAVVLQ